MFGIQLVICGVDAPTEAERRALPLLPSGHPATRVIHAFGRDHVKGGEGAYPGGLDFRAGRVRYHLRIGVTVTPQALRTIDLALWQVREALRINPWEARPQWVAEAAVTYMVVYLKDALQLLAKEGLRVDFPADDSGDDVTKRVTDFRNYACHNGSLARQLSDGVRISFALLGPGVNAIGGDVQLRNPSPDDFAYVYGKTILLHQGHLVRATNEAIAQITQVAGEMGMERALLTWDR